MKKKATILCLTAASVLLLFNITLSVNETNNGILLNRLILINQVQAESSSSNSCSYGYVCKDANDLKYNDKTDGAGNVTCCAQAATTRGKGRKA
jgi:hypothetical protein